ncbi:hypothetical protein [Limimaricola soesokkakensis]|nr:hypothetical protein [Limimaricola soesokkakensis]
MLEITARPNDQDLAMLLITGGTGTRPVGGPGSPATRCGFEVLDSEILRKMSPRIVLSALSGPGFDALEVAWRLVELGYRGSYRIIADALPHPAMVRDEIAAAVPELEVRLSCAPQPGAGSI